MILCYTCSSFPVPTNSNSIISSKDFAWLSSKRIRNFWVILLNKPGKKFRLCLSLVKPINIVHQEGCDEQKKKDAMNNVKNYILLWKQFWAYVWIKAPDLKINNITILVMVKGSKVITQEDLQRSLLSFLGFLLRFSPQFTPHLSS